MLFVANHGGRHLRSVLLSLSLENSQIEPLRMKNNDKFNPRLSQFSHFLWLQKLILSFSYHLYFIYVVCGFKPIAQFYSPN